MKTIKNLYKIAMLLFIVTAAISCSNNNSNGEAPKLVVSTKEATFDSEGGIITFTIDSNAKWAIENTQPWMKIDKLAGDTGTTTVTLTTVLSTSNAANSVNIRISADNGQARLILVSQAPYIFPSYNTSPIAPDATGMASTATQLIAKMKVGINLGNTLELKGINADPTEANIKFIKQMGFNAVRIPCGPDYVGNASSSSVSKIDDTYLAKVKQVVKWCVENDLYVFVNIHWDGGWLEGKEFSGGTPSHNYDPSSTRKDAVNAKQKALWQQMATTLRDFDEHLMFASSNEPNASTAAEMKILLSYHKTFIKAVRSTGGRNTYRTLILQGDTNLIGSDDFVAFNDPTPNHLAFEFHNYTPSSMTILSNDKVDGGWDDVRFYWGAGNHSTLEPNRNCTYGEETELLAEYNKIKTKFIDKGIPCVMGEFSSNRWNATSKFKPLELDKHNKSIDDWYTFNAKQCKAIGGVPFVWDTGGIFNRGTNVVNDSRSLNAIMAGVN